MEDELDFLGAEMAAANGRGETVHSLLRKILEKLTVSQHHSKLSMVYTVHVYTVYIIYCLLDYQQLYRSASRGTWRYWCAPGCW